MKKHRLRGQKFFVRNRSYVRLVAGFQLMAMARGFVRADKNWYIACIREFLVFMESNGINDIKKVKTKDISDYFLYLKSRQNMRYPSIKLSSSTQAGHMVILKLFFKHLLENGELDSVPAYFPRIKIVKVNFRYVLKLSEVKKVFSVCTSDRETAVLALTYGCGLRSSEVYNLDIDDVKLKDRILVVRNGKFQTNRVVPLSNKVISQLKRYLDKRDSYLNKVLNTNAFLINTIGARMEGLSMNIILKKLVKRTKDENLMRAKVTIHCLRHSIATHLLDKGADMEFVRRFLGHAWIDTTTIYVSKRKLRSQITKTLYESHK